MPAIGGKHDLKFPTFKLANLLGEAYLVLLFCI
jgi:hypothetical protein